MKTFNEYLTSNQKGILDRIMQKVEDEFSSENFDLFITIAKQNSPYPQYMKEYPQIGLHNKYGDSTDFASQASKVEPAITQLDAKKINDKVREWLMEYDELLFSSMDKNKISKYFRLLLAMNKDIEAFKKGSFMGSDIYGMRFK